jgi:short-subunit dehydrogenase
MQKARIKATDRPDSGHLKKKIMKTKRKTALVTGATSGIGHELAKIFAEEGYDLVLVSRSREELETVGNNLAQLHGVRATVVPADLSEPSAAEEVYNEVKAKGIQIDVLVNDAGQGVYGPFTTTELQEELNIIQLNVVSLMVLTKLFLKDMVNRGEGRILQLASIVSKIASPLMAVYAGTKAFVYNFSMSLSNELKDTGVTITALQPGVTDTDFFNKADATEMRAVQEGDPADPAKVARDGYEALMKGEAKVVSGAMNKMQAAMSNIISDEALAEQMRKQNEPTDQSSS